MGLRIALPDGSMMDRILPLVLGARLIDSTKHDRNLVLPTSWQGADEISLNRPQETPRDVLDGRTDLGFTGHDWLAEQRTTRLPIVLELPMGRKLDQPVKLVLAVAEEHHWTGLADLPQGARLASEYEKLAKQYCRRRGRRDIKIIKSWGNTETKIRQGKAEAIIDVYETGDSYFDNRLAVLDVLMESSTILIANPEAYHDPERRKLIDFFAKAVEGAWLTDRYIMVAANIPIRVEHQAAKVIGGMKGPTISPLYGSNAWVSMTSCVRKVDLLKIEESLTALGAEHIVPWEITPGMGFQR